MISNWYSGYWHCSGVALDLSCRQEANQFRANFLAARATIQPLSINDCQDEDDSLSLLCSMMTMVDMMPIVGKSVFASRNRFLRLNFPNVEA